MAHSFAGRLDLKILLNPLLLVCASVYGLNLLFLQKAYGFWFFRHYLNDLLCMPLVLFATVFIQRNFFRKPAYSLSGAQVGLAVAYFAIMFEGVIPLFNARYTADLGDVICYGIGGALFYFFGNAGKSEVVKKY